MSDIEMDPLANRSSSGLDYSTLLQKLLQQNGYTSDNSKHGVKSALKDYEPVFHSGAPKWLDLVWPSIAVSLLHLALSFKQPLPLKPEDAKFLQKLAWDVLTDFYGWKK